MGYQFSKILGSAIILYKLLFMHCESVNSNGLFPKIFFLAKICLQHGELITMGAVLCQVVYQSSKIEQR